MLKMKKFLFYLKFKPILYAISKRSASRVAVLSIAITAVNQYLNYRLKFINTDPWMVKDVVSGDRFLVERSGKKLEVQLCGISAKSDESKEYLRSLIAQGDGSVVPDQIKKRDGLTVAEVFMQIEPDYVQEIHLNTEMVLKSQAILGADYKACPNAEYLEMAAEK